MIRNRLVKPPTRHVSMPLSPPTLTSFILIYPTEFPFRCSPDEGQVSYVRHRLHVQGVAPSHVSRGRFLVAI